MKGLLYKRDMGTTVGQKVPSLCAVTKEQSLQVKRERKNPSFMVRLDFLRLGFVDSNR